MSYIPQERAQRTPRRTIRVSEDLWSAAQAAAAGRDETLSDVIRQSLERYVRRNRGQR